MEQKEMSFIDHLEEFRWHLIRSAIAIGVFTIAAFTAQSFIFDTIILAPTRQDFYTFKVLCQVGEWVNSESLCIQDIPRELQSRKLTGQFMMHIVSSFVIGFIAAFPYAFWELWRFIKPGLHTDEKKVSRGAVFSVSFLFMTGVLFGYYVILPLTYNFLANYQVSELVRNDFDITSYVSIMCSLVLGCGILFQLPIVAYFTSKLGVVTPQLMRQYRKHAVVVILVLGAILTPPDPISQILIAIPLFGLYQFSIFISNRVVKKMEKARLKELAALKAKE